MKLSVSFKLPKNLEKRNRVINELEKELERQGYTIVSREISNGEFLLVYDNHLTLEETEKLEQEYREKNKYYLHINGVTLDFRGICFSMLGFTTSFFVIKYFRFFNDFSFWIVVISMVLLYVVTTKYLNRKDKEGNDR